ncbi:protein of unknown function [Hyphomicrobium sp. MC1]|jgi:hypothetical protein|nr:protein of unknown function [Hyphomicrobium sp. MC1]
MLVKCVNDTTVLKREKHVIGTARRAGDNSAKCFVGTVPKRKTHARATKEKDFYNGANPYPNRLHFP